MELLSPGLRPELEVAARDEPFEEIPGKMGRTIHEEKLHPSHSSGEGCHRDEEAQPHG